MGTRRTLQANHRLGGDHYDIYGLTNPPLVHEFNAKKLEEYSTLNFNIEGLEGRPAVVEVLDASDKVVAAAPVKDSFGRIEYLTPGTYYARLFIDSTLTVYIPTDFSTRSSRREVYYYPKRSP